MYCLLLQLQLQLQMQLQMQLQLLLYNFYVAKFKHKLDEVIEKNDCKD